MDKDIRDMKSGEKQLFLRTHRVEILEYCQEHGFESTLEEYHITANTLQKMLDRGESYEGGRRRTMRGMSPTEKLLLRTEINEEAILNLRKEVKDLKDTFLKFQDEVSSQVASKFFKPLIEHLELSDGMTQDSKTSPGPEPAGFLESVKDPAPGGHAYDILHEAGEIAGDYEDNSEVQTWLLKAMLKARDEENWKRAYELVSHYFLQPYAITDPEYETKIVVWKNKALNMIEDS